MVYYESSSRSPVYALLHGILLCRLSIIGWSIIYGLNLKTMCTGQDAPKIHAEQKVHYGVCLKWVHMYNNPEHEL